MNETVRTTPDHTEKTNYMMLAIIFFVLVGMSLLLGNLVPKVGAEPFLMGLGVLVAATAIRSHNYVRYYPRSTQSAMNPSYAEYAFDRKYGDIEEKMSRFASRGYIGLLVFVIGFVAYMIP